jgi:hypothetical protein
MSELAATLAAMRERCDHATPGPWQHTQPCSGFAEIRCAEGIIFAVANPNSKIGERLVPPEEMDANLHLASASRTDLPRCLDALEIALKCIKEDADSWDRWDCDDRGKSGWHEALAAIEAALKGEPR